MEQLQEENYPRVFEIEEIISISWAFYKRHFWSLALITLIAVIPSIYITLATDTEKILSASLDFTNTNKSFPVIDINVLKIVLFSILISTFTFLAKLIFINDTLFSEGNKVGESLLKALNKFVPYFVTMLIFVIGIVTGTVLFIIPGIAFGVYFGFSTFALALKNKTIFESFTYSLDIVSGRWLKCAFYFLVLVLLNFALALPLSLLIVSFHNNIILVIANTFSALITNFIEIAIVVFFINFDDTKVN